jgi:hypothetical protein
VFNAPLHAKEEAAFTGTRQALPMAFMHACIQCISTTGQRVFLTAFYTALREMA